jgi:Late embryogenesis abundant protein
MRKSNDQNRFTRTALRLLLVSLVALLAACTGLAPGSVQPEVSVTSFTLAPQSSATAPRFNIGIRVINPNRDALRLGGMTYNIEIEGNRVLNGAKPDLPTVEGFGSADFVIEATPDLFGSIRLLTDLFSRQRAAIAYTFRARIDAGALLPMTVEQGGEFSLPAGR